MKQKTTGYLLLCAFWVLFIAGASPVASESSGRLIVNISGFPSSEGFAMVALHKEFPLALVDQLGRDAGHDLAPDDDHHPERLTGGEHPVGNGHAQMGEVAVARRPAACRFFHELARTVCGHYL